MGRQLLAIRKTLPKGGPRFPAVARLEALHEIPSERATGLRHEVVVGGVVGAGRWAIAGRRRAGIVALPGRITDHGVGRSVVVALQEKVENGALKGLIDPRVDQGVKWHEQ